MKRLKSDLPPRDFTQRMIVCDSTGWRDDEAIAAKLAALWRGPLSPTARAFIAALRPYEPDAAPGDDQDAA